MVVRRKMPIWYHWVVLGGVGGTMRGEEMMTRTEGEMMKGTEEGMMTEGGEEGMLRKTEAEGAEMMSVEEMMIEEEGGEMTTEESGGEMTGEDIMATKEVDMQREMKEGLDMKSVGGAIGIMKAGEDDQT